MIHWGLPINRLENRLDIRLLGWANLGFTRLYHQLSVHQCLDLPRVGPAIVVSNHTSALDPALIQSCASRLIIWMMAKEYYDVKGAGWVFRTVGVIPVERSGRDTAGTRAALRALANGQVLGIFPEGKIEATRDFLPFHTGVALLAIKSRVPVYPVYLDGTQRGKEMLPAVLTPSRASVTFGPPVEFDRSSTTKPALEQATEKIRDAINILAGPGRRGV